ncbi:MAG: histidine kinase [Desulfosarcina sp.]|jgi:PAS domain S-box-containing protein
MSEKSLLNGFDVLNFHVEAPYFKALYNAPVPVIIAREDGQLLLINRIFKRATGLSSDEIPKIDDWVKHLRSDPDFCREVPFTGIFEPEKTLKPISLSMKTKNEGTLMWDLFFAPLGRLPNGQRMIIGIASDVTEKLNYQRYLEGAKNGLEKEVSKRTEALNTTIEALESEISERKRMGEALTQSQERLRTMSRRTLTVLEADRRTVSKELHDSIGASLAAIKFSLEEKEMKRSQNGGHLDDSLEQEIAYLLSTIKETKQISANLRPTTLDDLGLMATIKWYLRQFKRMYGTIHVDYTTDIEETDVPESMKIIIYRIIQEGLSNAEKHSEANSIRLQIKFINEKKAIALFIEDDGQGFDVEEVLSQKDPLGGYGLIAMRERCEIFGGSFIISSQVGKGTKIKAILPT